MAKDEDKKNKFSGRQICIIFANFPEESFTYREMLDRTGFPEGTVKSRIHRLVKQNIIKRYKIIHDGDYHYKLLDKKKAKEYIEGKSKSSRKPRDTPTPPFKRDLASLVPQVPHHKIQQVKLTDDEWSRTEHLYTKPKDNKDRGGQRILEKKTFKVVISPNTLKGALYILEDNWKGELQKIYPELAEQISAKEELRHLGVSFDAEVWQNFRMQSDDMKLLFATSHFWRELDVEGRELAVNSFMQHIMRDSFDKTTYDAMMNKILEQILINQEGNDDRMYQVIEVLHKIDERFERQVKANEQIAEILGKLVGGESDAEKKKDEEVPIKELSRDDLIMFG